MDFQKSARGSVKGLLGTQCLKMLPRELWVTLQTIECENVLGIISAVAAGLQVWFKDSTCMVCLVVV